MSYHRFPRVGKADRRRRTQLSLAVIPIRRRYLLTSNIAKTIAELVGVPIEGHADQQDGAFHNRHRLRLGVSTVAGKVVS